MIGYGGMLMESFVAMMAMVAAVTLEPGVFFAINTKSIGNQMLAAVAFSTVTTILIKMGKARFMWVTAVPMGWLVVSTFTAAFQRVFHPDPRIGFLSAASAAQARIDGGLVKPENLDTVKAVVFNNQFDAALGLGLVVVVGLIVAESVRQWILLLSGRTTSPLAGRAGGRRPSADERTRVFAQRIQVRFGGGVQRC